jgi:hypothetical protein
MLGSSAYVMVERKNVSTPTVLAMPVMVLFVPDTALCVAEKNVVKKDAQSLSTPVKNAFCMVGASYVKLYSVCALPGSGAFAAITCDIPPWI